MRMWMCDPEILCQKHLCGEHLEVHMFVGAIMRRKKLTGFVHGNLLEAKSLIHRHRDLADEMFKRGYNHKSEIEECDISNLPIDERNYKIDKQRSLWDLLKRCTHCRKRFKNKVK